MLFENSRVLALIRDGTFLVSAIILRVYFQ